MSNLAAHDVRRPSDALNGTAPAIEMVNLCKTFGTFTAVDQLSLTVQQGGFSGC